MQSSFLVGVALTFLLLAGLCQSSVQRPYVPAQSQLLVKNTEPPNRLTQDNSLHAASSATLLGRKLSERGAMTGPVMVQHARHNGELNAHIQRPLIESEAHRCLSLNVYWEARNQSVAGQIAVAQVAINRARDTRYPDDICDVVFDHKQFSWYWDGKPDSPLEPLAWEAAILVASAALSGTGHVELQGVTHYHAVYTQPYWRDFMTQVVVIGDHVFYSD